MINFCEEIGCKKVLHDFFIKHTIVVYVYFFLLFDTSDTI